MQRNQHSSGKISEIKSQNINHLVPRASKIAMAELRPLSLSELLNGLFKMQVLISSK